MSHHYVLIDFENVRVKTLALLKDRDFRVKVFLGPKEARLPVELVLAMHELGQHADYIKLDTGGSNALDFHIAYYLGKLAEAHQGSQFCIISKDKGFDPLVAHMQSKGITCKRVATIEELLGLSAAAATSTRKEPAVTRPKATPAKPAAPKAAPAKPAAPKAPPVKAAPAKPTVPAAPARQPAPKASAPKPALTPTLQAVIDNLKARGTSRPRKLKSLTSTLVKTLSLKLSEQQAAQTIADLQALELLTIKDGQVAYRL